MKPESLTRILSVVAFVAMLSASSSVFAQVKIGTNPTTIGTTNNLEVEASTTGRKTSIDKTTGQVTIQDGTQGAGRVLTSDATGNSSWQPLATQRIAETVFIGQQSGEYLITQFDGTFDSPKDRIPLVPRAGSLPGYDASTKKYTIQEAGYYRFHIGAFIAGTLAPGVGTGTTASLYLVPSLALQQYQNINSSTGPVLSIFWEGFYAAGTQVNSFVLSQGYNQNLRVQNAFLSITKLF